MFSGKPEVKGFEIIKRMAIGVASITTSSDGKYVYIIGYTTKQFYRSEDFGKTFSNFEIEK